MNESIEEIHKLLKDLTWKLFLLECRVNVLEAKVDDDETYNMEQKERG